MATANAIELLMKRLMFDQVQPATAFLLGNAGNGLDSLMKLDKKLDEKLDSAATSFLSLPLPPMTGQFLSSYTTHVWTAAATATSSS